MREKRPRHNLHMEYCLCISEPSDSQIHSRVKFSQFLPDAASHPIATGAGEQHEREEASLEEWRVLYEAAADAASHRLNHKYK